MDGKALSRVIDRLDRLAIDGDVTPLTEFVSISSDDFGLMAEAGLPPSLEEWFSAADGLRTARLLLHALGQAADAEPAVLADLQALESLLVDADAQQVRWHLSVDF